ASDGVAAPDAFPRRGSPRARRRRVVRRVPVLAARRPPPGPARAAPQRHVPRRRERQRQVDAGRGDRGRVRAQRGGREPELQLRDARLAFVALPAPGAEARADAPVGLLLPARRDVLQRRDVRRGDRPHRRPRQPPGRPQLRRAAAARTVARRVVFRAVSRAVPRPGALPARRAGGGAVADAADGVPADPRRPRERLLAVRDRDALADRPRVPAGVDLRAGTQRRGARPVREDRAVHGLPGLPQPPPVDGPLAPEAGRGRV
ncbi:MAG: ABC transporter, ATP-binding protein, partial [uncultured Phycisphaerae bacterium]